MIGFIGLGAMGKPMAGHALRSTGELTVFNRSPEAARELAGLGATHAASIGELAAGSDVIVTSLPGPDEVRAVLLGPDFRRSLRAGSLVIDTSTITPELAIEVTEVLAGQGVSTVDAPVSGGQQGARDATLSAMVGGDADSFARARPILEMFATKVVHVGPAGAGQATKAANQIIVAGTIAIIGEAVSMLRASEVNLGAALEAIGGGLAGSEVLRRKADALLADDYPAGFRIDLHVKDLRIALDHAAQRHVPVPMTAVATQLMISNQAHGEGSLDHSALARTIRRLAGATP